MRDGFSITSYSRILTSFLDAGYQTKSFSEADPSRPHLVLRHDIDLSPRFAVLVAEAERALECRATYFVLLRSKLYNALDDENLQALEKITALGHEIGLHFDATLYEPTLTAIERAAQKECEILEGVLGQKISTISFHRPVQALQDVNLPFAGRINTYQWRYTKEMGYCSDSRGEWRFGHPIDHPAFAKKSGLQLLTHPIWWTGPGTPRETLIQFVAQHTADFEDALAHNCVPYEPILRERRHQHHDNSPGNR